MPIKSPKPYIINHSKQHENVAQTSVKHNLKQQQKPKQNPKHKQTTKISNTEKKSHTRE
jgi:hypothetical protein